MGFAVAALLVSEEVGVVACDALHPFDNRDARRASERLTARRPALR
jgi:hypothetical protein